MTLKADDSGIVKWHIDASFAVHPDCKSHTGAIGTLGKGAFLSMSTKQKINVRSSTEAELVGVDDAAANVLWVRHFLLAQGYDLKDNIIYQDNKSAMLLEKNGMQSAGKRSKHINVRHFFIKDRHEKKEVSIEYCPTDEMIGDYFTKPLQGRKFKKFRKLIMGL